MSEKPTVLVVDDDLLVLPMVKIVLELSLEVDILTTPHPRQALAWLETMPISLLLTDFMMPEMNGLVLIKKLRQSGRQLPVVILTGYHNEPELMSNLEQWAPIDLIFKPWANDDLVSRVQRLLPNGDHQPVASLTSPGRS